VKRDCNREEGGKGARQDERKGGRGRKVDSSYNK